MLGGAAAGPRVRRARLWESRERRLGFGAAAVLWWEDDGIARVCFFRAALSPHTSPPLHLQD